IQDIARLVSEKKIQDISDIRDESARGKIRVVIELKKGANSKFILNRLYKFTRLQDKFGANILALVGGRPRVLNLKQIIEEYISYRKRIIKLRTEFDLRKAEERQEIVLGLLIALKDIDNVVKLIKAAKNSLEALESLKKKFDLTQRQAHAILEMKLSQLTSLETDKLKTETQELKTKIEEYKTILSSEKEVLNLIKKDVRYLIKEFGDNRRTTVMKKIQDIEEKDLVQDKEVVVTITEKGYCKRMDIQSYKEQKRGGKGVIGSNLSTEDFVRQLIFCSTHDYLMFFTSRGRVFWLKAHEIPEAERYSKGKSLANFIKLNDEKITNVISVKKFDDFLFKRGDQFIVPRHALYVAAKRLRQARIVGLEVPPCAARDPHEAL
ncbi:MAG: DNA gyrase subunit A, partial [Nanoarchaeota archaeon]